MEPHIEILAFFYVNLPFHSTINYFFKSNELSEYSYFGLGYFFCFQGKVLRFVHARF